MRKWIALLLCGGMLLAAGCSQPDAPADGGDTGVTTTTASSATTTTTVGSADSVGSTTTTQPPSDGKYEQALAALDNGEVGEAYKLLCSTTDERAPALLHHFVWQPVQVWGENPSTHTYDGNGYPATATWGISNYTYTWNAAGQLTVKRNDENSASDYWEQTDYTYENGLLVKRVRTTLYGPGETETFSYDGSGNLLQWIYDSSYDPDDYTRTYTYDAAGNRLSMDIQVANGSGREATYTYDAAGRLLSKMGQYGSGDTERMTRTYNEKGQIATSEHVLPYGTAKHTYTYGERGELLCDQSEWVGENITFCRYIYDDFGRREAMIVERDGEEVNRHTYTYEDDETLTFVGGGSIGVYQLFYYPKGINQELVLNALNGIDYYDAYIE